MRFVCTLNCDGRVTLLAGPIFSIIMQCKFFTLRMGVHILHILQISYMSMHNLYSTAYGTAYCLDGTIPSRPRNQIVRERCFEPLTQAKGSIYFSYKRLLKLTQLGG